MPKYSFTVIASFPVYRFDDIDADTPEEAVKDLRDRLEMGPGDFLCDGWKFDGHVQEAPTITQMEIDNDEVDESEIPDWPEDDGPPFP